MQSKRNTGRSYTQAIVIIFLLLIGCRKQVVSESSEVKISILNSDFVKVKIYDEKGSFASSAILDYFERDGRVYVLHLIPGKYSYTATDTRKANAGNFVKGKSLMELAIDMQ